MHAQCWAQTTVAFRAELPPHEPQLSLTHKHPSLPFGSRDFLSPIVL